MKLAALGSADSLQTLTLTPDEAERPAAGSRPACVVRSPDGRRFFFKSSPPGHVAAEILSFDVRRLGRRPAVATAARSLELPGLGEVAGMVQPFLEHAGDRLPTDPCVWSELQREVMLREHPWEWLLGNLDTHVDQYVLFGPAHMPLNIDWDHALEDLSIEHLDRFTKRNPAVAPIRNALYDAYARGDVALDFAGVRHQVRRIARLDERALRRALAAWAERAGVEEAVHRDVAERLIRRKRGIGPTFRVLLRDLRRERLARRLPGQSLPLRERVRITAHDAWQRLLIDTLHDRVVVPWLRGYRKVLEARDAITGRREGGRGARG